VQSILKHFKTSRTFMFLLHTYCESLQECEVLPNHEEISTIQKMSHE
jgi:hypothetical protein